MTNDPRGDSEIEDIKFQIDQITFAMSQCSQSKFAIIGLVDICYKSRELGTHGANGLGGGVSNDTENSYAIANLTNSGSAYHRVTPRGG